MHTYTASKGDHTTEAETVAELALAAAAAAELEGTNQILIPAGAQLADLEGYGPAPSRMRGTVELHDEGSFVEYADGFGLDGMAVFLDSRKAEIVAILNHHEGATLPGWGDARARLGFVEDEVFRAWLTYDGEWLDQAAFAEFVDEQAGVFQTPNGAEMREAVEDVKLAQHVSFGSKINRGNGDVTFAFTVETGEDGELRLPTEFTVGLRPFEDGPAYAVNARLLYRLKGGTLRLRYDLLNLDDVLADFWRDVQTRLGDHFPERVFRGQAPASLR